MPPSNLHQGWTYTIRRRRSREILHILTLLAFPSQAAIYKRQHNHLVTTDLMDFSIEFRERQN